MYETISFSKNEELLRNYQVYSKMNVKSKAFLKFKPLEELSMLLSIPDNIKLIEQSKKEDSQYDVLVSKTNITEKNKYATLLNNIDREDNDRRYFESLLIKTPSDIEKMKEIQGAKAAITTEVILENDDGGGIIGHRIFTDQEQRKFIKEVFDDFYNVNFEELIEYFDSLNDKDKSPDTPDDVNSNTSRRKR